MSSPSSPPRRHDGGVSGRVRRTALAMQCAPLEGWQKFRLQVSARPGVAGGPVCPKTDTKE
eukprot:384196-Pyramimonas_sp.AAC.1